ncbi:putative serine-aspartate repeat-containing SdrF domain protein, partial [Clostridioides difficile CD68]
MQQKCKKKALSMILSISMGLGPVASFNASNTFADTIEESTNAGNAEGGTNAGNAEGDTNAGDAEGDTNAGDAEGDTNAGDVEEEATAEEPTSVGDFKISGGEINVDFKFASGVLTILSGKQMTIQNNNPNTPTTHRIVIPKDVKAELIFDGVNIKTASNSPFTLTPDKDGGAYAHVILQDGSENKLESGDVYYPGMRAGKGTTLIIDDSVVNRDIEGEFIVPEGGKIPRDVTLENGDKLKKGDRLTLLDSNNRGSLKVVGNYYSAGIGGGNTESGGNIIINGGAITAIGQESSRNTGYGAGIGGGGNGSGGDITINGGIITAKG